MVRIVFGYGELLDPLVACTIVVNEPIDGLNTGVNSGGFEIQTWNVGAGSEKFVVPINFLQPQEGRFLQGRFETRFIAIDSGSVGVGKQAGLLADLGLR